MTLKELEAYKEELENMLQLLGESHGPSERGKVARSFQLTFSKLLKKVSQKL